MAECDVNVDAGNNITLSENYDISKTQEMPEKSFAGVTGSVNVGILGTIKDTRDVAKRFTHGDVKHKIGNGLIGGLNGNRAAIVRAHSPKGAITVGKGLRDFKKRGIHNIAKKTDIYLLGTADKALSIANPLYVVNDGEKDHVYLQNHLLNPIGIGFGHNPPTFIRYPRSSLMYYFHQKFPCERRGER